MKLFRCQRCEQVLYFENTACLRCGAQLGYLPGIAQLSAVAPDGDGWIADAQPGVRQRFCGNREPGACNWMLPADDASPFCRACRHNGTIPDLCAPERLSAWRGIEAAKRRLFYTLLRLRLPIPSPDGDHPEPLVFDFLADPPHGPRVMTGHDNGRVTIALAEADDAIREAARVSMGEQYRTLLGHFRHEVGHYYWDRLVRDGDALDGFRALFGDERRDYGEALRRHHADGPSPGWQDRFVSRYATMHPWEDWAETWAHYLHIVDTLEAAAAFGIRIDPGIAEDGAMSADFAFDPYRVGDLQRLLDAWLPLTYAMNSLNRAMGQPDPYPFVIAPPVVEKMAFVHRLVRQAGLPAKPSA